jgi:metallo-beta-lactamase family protein
MILSLKEGKGGNIVIPTFAIERAQELMYHLSRLVRENAIPFIKIFLDSPMAVGVTDVFRRHKDCLDNETVKLFQADESPFHFPGMKLVRTIDESKAINTIKEPVIILAGSGMCTGGRIKHHLAQNVSRPESTLLFVGFQASGTLGRLIVNGMEKVRIHGKYYNFRAKVEQIHGFSAHADRKALLRWLGHFEAPPEKLFVTHGEEKSALSLADAVKKKKGWKVSVPKYLDEFELIK